MRKIIHIFLSLVIVYAGTVSAYANTSVGGWSALDVITAGATTTINATKTVGGKVLQSAVTVAPQASKVGKYLIKGGGTAALLLAVPQLIGEGVDWVLDPENNSVKYFPPTDNAWYTINGSCSTAGVYYSAQELCVSLGTTFVPKDGWPGDTCGGKATQKVVKHTTKPSCDASYFHGAPADEEKYLPIDTVAAQVISNAEAGDPSSQEAVKATALEGFAAGEHDAALDAAATEAGSDAGTDNPTDPNNPTDPQDPAAPFDPSSIIAAINALKALLAGILSSITGLSDLFNDTPPEKTQEETDVPVEAPPDVKNPNEFDVDYIGFSSQCPTLSPFSVGIGGASSTMTFDMTPLCNLAVTIRPAIIAIAYFIGLGVIASAIRET